MQQNDDEKFEGFLKQFRPRAPQPLPIQRPERVTRRRFVFAAWAAVTAALLLAAVLTMHLRPSPPYPSDGSGNVAGGQQLAGPQPLTIATANALLAHAPSVKAVADQMAFKSQSTQPSKGMRSALAALSQENIKL